MNRMEKAAGIFGVGIETDFALETPSKMQITVKFTADGLMCRIGKDKWAKANAKIFEGMFTGTYKIRRKK